MISKAICELLDSKDLSSDLMRSSMQQIMEGEATPAQIGAFLALLRIKGETVNEITQAARVMKEKAVRINVNGDVIDTCSTGGTGINHFNISTTTAFVLAGMDVKVAKHGNRAVSGRCGSADVLEKAGVDVGLEPDQVKECIEKYNIGFLFAPTFHRAMKHAAGPRREIGIRTIFNILGPLTNPAGVTRQLLGVYDRSLTEPLAVVLGNLGVVRAMVVHGAGGLDEISLAGPTTVSELKNDFTETYQVEPSDFGLPSADISGIKGGDETVNAGIMRRVLEGEKGPYRDYVLANASAAFVIAEKAADFKEGVEIAEESIDSGSAASRLDELASCSGDLTQNQ